MNLDSIFIAPLLGVLLCFEGCTAARDIIVVDTGRPALPERVQAELQTGQPSAEKPDLTKLSPISHFNSESKKPNRDTKQSIRPLSDQQSTSVEQQAVKTVSFESQQKNQKSNRIPGTLALDGRTYQLHLIEEEQHSGEPTAEQLANREIKVVSAPASEEIDDSVTLDSQEFNGVPLDSANVIQLNLPTALSMVGGQHPAVGFAQWRVQEAYAQLDRAQVLWLPSIQPGFSFHRHDGNYQASNGDIVDVNRNSFQSGLGAGATGAGTTNPRPGVVANFHLADAIFQPEIAEKRAWAEGHAANGDINQQLLNVAVAYLELLNAEQNLRIVDETQKRTEGLAKLTHDFAEAGEGLQADADRLQTELILVKDRLAMARERVEVSSAQLSQALSLSAESRIVPLDYTVVPFHLVSVDAGKGALISTGLSHRPELKEAQALVAMACEQYKRQKYAPFVPSLLLGFTTGTFGGGLGNNLSNTSGRYDVDAIVTWEVRNLGFSESAARRETFAKVEQAKFSKVRLMDRVAREIAEAHAQVVHRIGRIDITRQAIQSAENSYKRNLSRIRDGNGLPLEVLQSVRALEDARRAYLTAVIAYNESQFRLQWALGWTVVAPTEQPTDS